MAEVTTTAGRAGRWPPLLTIRLAVAFVQAIALLGLTTVMGIEPRVWPATSAATFGPLLLVAIFIPFLVVHGLGEMRARPLAMWTGVATLVIVALSLHAATREDSRELWPWFPLWLALSMSLFVAHVLVIDATAERRLLPSYERHFDTAWKLGVQAVLSVVFLGVFWGILWLGAGLFKLVGLSLFEDLISHPWFAYPASTLAMALAIHVTDVQPALIRGVRSLALTLFSWLLPLLVAILVGFLGSLLMTSVEALWSTKFATVLLLISAALVVFLINCCYQDGGTVEALPRVKRLAGTAGALALVPLVGLAVWALGLRVGQYGWTVDRIMGACAIVIAACYAIGYAAAALGARHWLKRLEVTNVVAAYVFLGLVLALFSPLADPARLMVADQVARLRSSAVPPDQFDFAALRFDGARWGKAALAELATAGDVPSAATVNAKAQQAQGLTVRTRAEKPGAAAEAAARVATIAVYPAGRTLPQQVADLLVGPGAVVGLTCDRDKSCVARFVGLRPGAPEAVMVLEHYSGYLFEQGADGRWQKTAQIDGPLQCPAVRQGIAGGTLTLEPHPWPSLVIDGLRIAFSPSGGDACPPATR